MHALYSARAFISRPFRIHRQMPPRGRQPPGVFAREQGGILVERAFDFAEPAHGGRAIAEREMGEAAVERVARSGFRSPPGRVALDDAQLFDRFWVAAVVVVSDARSERTGASAAGER